MKFRKWLLVASLSVASAVSLVFAACTTNDDQNTQLTEGPETGVYYYAAGNDEYLISLSGGNRFTLHMMGEDKSGEYTLSDGSLSFDFSKDEDGTASATLSDDVLTLTYEGGEWRFLKKIPYTVSFEEEGGSEVADVTVVNGQTLARPADPVRSGYKLIAWTTAADDLDTAFVFDSTAVTSNITLYAYWAEVVPGQSEYTVDFDLGYDNAPAMESMETVGGRLYGVPTPEQENCTFDGWWVSMYDDGEKLSYRWTEDMTFTEDTTLFAVWNEEGSSALRVYVDSQGVSWDRLSSNATLTIEGPAGFDTIRQSVGVSAGTSYAVDFASAPAGDYVVTLESGNSSVNAYYKNRALARVSEFTVMDPSVLVFEGVENAERYYITIECGDGNHAHTMLDLGSATSYNFANCSMPEGGIRFTVTAVADGYASSTSRTFVYNRMLGEVTGLTVNEETQTLVWNSVAGAVRYIVTVNGEAVNNGARTSFSLKSYAPGTLEISVRAETNGYNSAAASTISYQKTSLAAPSDVRIENTSAVWSAVDGATSYEVRIGTQAFPVEAPEGDEVSFDLAAASGLDLLEDADYQISVRAIGAENSLWSDPVDARYLALYQTLLYEHNMLSWRPVIGAVSYSVQVNGGSVQTYPAGTDRVQITLTQAGTNTISVWFNDGTEDNEAVTLEVYAYSVTFDSRGGSAVQSVYVATGDAFTLPEPTQLGYDFAAWYNTPRGADANGAIYDDEYFSGRDDLVLYAYWIPKTYTINLNYGEGGTGPATAQVTYMSAFTLPVPETNGVQVFLGWYSTADTNGMRYTDESGNCMVDAWTRTDENATIYAVYVEALELVLDGEGYAVRQGDSISRVINLVIPAEVNGRKIVTIDEYAFSGCSRLVSVSIPDTVRLVASTAFDGCTKLNDFYVRETGEADPVYSAIEGSLVYNNPMTQEVELAFVPAAREGVYTVPEGVTRLGTNVFYSTDFTEINIAGSVTSIAANAIVDARYLTAITFLDGGTQPLTMDVNAITSNTSSYLKKLTSLTLPARLQAFSDGGEAVDPAEFFSKFEGLEAITIVGTYSGAAYSSYNGMLLNANGDTILYSPAQKEFDDVLTVPNSIVAIGDYAFRDSSIQEIVFHSAMRSIGEGAFYNVESLTKVTFRADANPSGLVIGDYAFYDCINLATIAFEETGELVGSDYRYATSCGVREIGAFAFSNTAASKILLPSTLVEIGEESFSEIKELKDIDFSHVNSDLIFGDFAFSSCTGLTEINFPDNVGVIDFNAVFHGCTNMKAFNVSPTNPNYTTGEDGVLYNKSETVVVYLPEGISEYSIPDTITTIGGGAFYNKKNLVSIVIPTGVTSIGTTAFEGCSNLSSVTFTPGGQSPLTIGNRAFYGCSALTSIALPERTVSIGAESFYNSALSSVTLNEGLVSIGDSAFRNTKSLNTISIPSTVSSIGGYAFYSSELSSISFPAAASAEDTVELTLGSNVFGSTKFAELTLPERLVGIPENAFYGNSNLTSVVIPTTVRNVNGERAIGYRAFYQCTALTTVTFTLGGTQPLSIADGAFYGCSKLTSLTLPARASEFTPGEYDVFELSTSGGDSPYYMGYVFGDDLGDNVAPVSDIFVAEEEGVTANFWSYDGVLYSGDRKIVLFCPMGKEGEVEISKYAETMRSGAFHMCENVTSIVFEESENVNGVDFYLEDSIDSNNSLSANIVFYGCAALKSIEFPARLTSLGDYSVYVSCVFNPDEYGLTSVTFAEGCRLSEIGNHAFKGGKFESFALPENVATIGESPFSDCENLTTITVSKLTDADGLANLIDGVDALEAIIVPEGSTGLKVDEGLIFSADMKTLVYRTPEFTATSYEIPATVTNIPANTFLNLKTLTTLTFEKGGTEPLTIGDSAFKGTGITAVELPARLGSMGVNVFQSCASLKSLTFEQGFDYGSIPNYTFDGTALESVNIPASVAIIGEYAFRNNKSLTTVTFGSEQNLSQLNAIRRRAFYGCSALESIEIPASVTELGGYTSSNTLYNGVTNPAEVFYGCTSLETVTFLGSNIKVFGTKMFYNCSSLESINLERLTGLTGIGESAFYNCASLQSIIIPESVTTLGKALFQGCKELKTAVVNSAANLSEDMFNGCSALSSVTLNSSIKQIGNSAFEACTSLVRITLPSELQDLGVASSYLTDVNVFYGCTALESIRIPEGVEVIGANTFYGCSNLSDVQLGNNIVTIYDSAFRDCTSLASIDLPDNLVNLGVSSNITSSSTSVSNSSSSYVFAGTGLTSISIPATVKGLGAYAFQNCGALTSVVFEGADEGIGSLLTIGNYAFDGCTELTGITIPASVTTLGSYAFRGCAKITEMTVPETVAKIGGGNLFENCTELTTVAWNTSYNIPDNAFKGCSKLETITINPEVQKIGKCVFQSCEALKAIELPESLTALGGTSSVSVTTDASVFAGCTALKSVVIPEAVTVIAKNTFNGCTALETVTVSSDQINIGPDAFAGCTALKTPETLPQDGYVLSVFGGGIYLDSYANGTLAERKLASYIGDATVISADTFAEGTTAIGAYAFYQNANITEVTIPAEITSIEIAAFSSCSNLTTVTFLESDDPGRTLTIEDGSSSTGVFAKCTKLTTVKLPDGLTYIAEYMFNSCGFTGIEIPASVKKIGDYAFGSTKLTELVIPEGVETIGESAFRTIGTLTSLTIPSTVTSIGKYAFYQCKLLEEIYYNAAECADLPTSNNVFYQCGTSSSGITVYIGETVESIPSYLFHPGSATSNSGVPNIVTIVIDGNALESIGQAAFRGVATIETIYYGGSMADLTALMTGIGSDNTELLAADIYLYSEDTPPANDTNDGFAGVGNVGGVNIAGYWHWTQDEGNNVVTEWVFTPAEPEPEPGEGGGETTEPGTEVTEPTDPEQDQETSSDEETV